MLRSLNDDNLVWPTIDAIADAQRKFGTITEIESYSDGSDSVWKNAKKPRIPATVTDLLYRLCNIAHCGPQGH